MEMVTDDTICPQSVEDFKKLGLWDSLSKEDKEMAIKRTKEIEAYRATFEKEVKPYLVRPI